MEGNTRALLPLARKYLGKRWNVEDKFEVGKPLGID
jgi:hypothetical protein